MFCSPWGQSKVHLSRNGGSNWDFLPLTTSDGREVYVEFVAINPGDPSKIYAGGFFGHLHYSTNGGDTWDYVRLPDNSPLLTDSDTQRDNRVFTFAYAPSDAQYLYVGTSHGGLWRTSSGATQASGWEELATPLPPVRDTIIRMPLAGQPTDPNTVYLGYSNPAASTNVRPLWRGVRQPNGTFQWTDISAISSPNALPFIPVSALVIDPDAPRRIFVANNVSVFATEDEGGSWQPFMEGLPRMRVVDLRLRSRTRVLYAAVYGCGVFRRWI